MMDQEGDAGWFLRVFFPLICKEVGLLELMRPVN